MYTYTVYLSFNKGYLRYLKMLQIFKLTFASLSV